MSGNGSRGRLARQRTFAEGKIYRQDTKEGNLVFHIRVCVRSTASSFESVVDGIGGDGRARGGRQASASPARLGRDRSTDDNATPNYTSTTPNAAAQTEATLYRPSSPSSTSITLLTLAPCFPADLLLLTPVGDPGLDGAGVTSEWYGSRKEKRRRCSCEQDDETKGIRIRIRAQEAKREEWETYDGQLWDEHERERDKVDKEEDRVVGGVVRRDEEAVRSPSQRREKSRLVSKESQGGVQGETEERTVRSARWSSTSWRACTELHRQSAPRASGRRRRHPSETCSDETGR